MHGNNDLRAHITALLKRKSKVKNIHKQSINLQEEYDSEQEQLVLHRVMKHPINLHQDDSEQVLLLDSV
jgi:hypothetical protein